MKKLIAMLGAVVAAVTSALAATVTFDEGSSTMFTVINDSKNAGNYAWKNCTGFNITIPVKEGLASGTKVLLKSITFVKADSWTDNNNNTPTTVTIGGYKGTAVTTGTAADGWAGSNIASRNTAVYSFGDGAILTVGTAAEAKIAGVVNFRAAPTSQNLPENENGDKDLLIGILNDGTVDTAYQPLTKLVCEVITTTEATVSEDTTLESLDSLTWSNGTPTAELPGVVTIPEGVTLTISASTTLPKLTFTGAGTVKYVGPKTIDGRSFSAPFIFGLGWTGSLNLVNITVNFFDFSQFVGVDTIKMTGVSGHIGQSDGQHFDGTIVLEDGESNTVAFNITDGFGTNGYTFDAIAGSGTLKVTGQTSAREQFIFKDAIDFTGTVIIEGANNKKSVLFGSAKDYSDATIGTIIIGTGATATIPSGKTWTAVNGIVVKGTVKPVGSLGSAVKGDGTVAYDAYPTSAPNLANDFAGVVEIAKTTLAAKTGVPFVSFVKENSTLKIFGLTGDDVYIGNGASATIPGSVELVDGATLTLNNGNSNATYTFNKICGTGTFDAVITDHNGRGAPTGITFNVTTLGGGVAVNCNRTLKVTTIETLLETQPETKTRVLALGADTTIANIDTTALKLSDGVTTIAGLASIEGEGDDRGVYVTPGDAPITIGDRSYWSVTEALASLQEGETYADIVITTDEIVIPADYKLIEKGEVYGLAVRDATTVYLKSGKTFALSNGAVVKLVDGDIITVNNGSGNLWPVQLPEEAATHTLVFEASIGGNGLNIEGIPEGQEIVNNNPNTWVWGNVGANAKITGTGIFEAGYTSGTNVSTINDGVVISSQFQTSTGHKVIISGSVTISGTIVKVEEPIYLAADSSLTCTKLEEGDTITHVTTDVADSHVEYQDGAYVVVAGTPETEVPTWLEGEDEATVGKYNTWKAANESSITEATTEEMIIEAFLFGCEPTAEAIAEARANFLVDSIDITPEGPVIGYTEEGYNGVVEVIGSATIDGEYTVEAAGENTAKFFKLQLVLPSKASPVEED